MLVFGPIATPLLAAATGVLTLAALSNPAAAASSDWARSEGGEIRLVTAGAPDAAGKLQGALQIQLKPGWKTYWRDPGSSGVAPSLDIGDAGSVEMQFPAPGWHNDGQYDWAGYDAPVIFPVTMTLKRSGPLEATAFVGVCETICIPFQATLKLDPAQAADDLSDRHLVDSAAIDLPKSAAAGFGIGEGVVKDDHILFKASPAQATGAELFLAGTDGYQFGKPALQSESGAFSVKILARPAAKPDGAGIHYTLVSATGEAVSGIVPYF